MLGLLLAAGALAMVDIRSPRPQPLPATPPVAAPPAVASPSAPLGDEDLEQRLLDEIGE
jgi:hypothetical protein